MATLKITRVLALPSTLASSTMYMVPDASGGTFTITMTANDGTPYKVKSGVSQTDIDALLEGKVDKVAGMGLSQTSFTTAEKTKLAGIADGATKNQTDAFLRDRANHTGFQPISSVTGLTDALDGKANLITGRFVASQEELDAAFNTVPDQAAVFANWLKISNNASMVFPAIPAETQAWAFDPENNRVYNTTNSSSFIAAVSDRSFDQYEILARIYSNNADDDTIGLLLAFDKDPETGREYTLSLNRSPGGNAPVYSVVYNYGQGGEAQGGSYVVFNGNPYVIWGNGGRGETAAQAGFTNNNPGWAGLAAQWSNAGGCRLWAKRNGDIIEFMTSQWNDPNVLDPTTLGSIDLNSNAKLQRFRGAKPYGFSSYSQANSFWDIIQFTNPKDAIYDLVNKKVYVFNVSGWIESPDIKFTDLPKRCFLSNPETSRMFFIQEDSKILNMGATPLI